MQDDYVWVDRRWQETNWLDAFRMRLCGWLPSDLATKAIANGLILQVESVENDKVALTQKARLLTDIASGVGDSPHNCVMLANVLIAKGFESSWLIKAEHARGMFLKKEQTFPKCFRDDILTEISSTERL
jgi:hypothetical protein